MSVAMHCIEKSKRPVREDYVAAKLELMQKGMLDYSSPRLIEPINSKRPGGFPTAYKQGAEKYEDKQGWPGETFAKAGKLFKGATAHVSPLVDDKFSHVHFIFIR
jgi:hypothetical protein